MSTAELLSVSVTDTVDSESEDSVGITGRFFKNNFWKWSKYYYLLHKQPNTWANNISPNSCVIMLFHKHSKTNFKTAFVL